jgi:predicted MFS family arabinose efflux permease
MIDLALFRQPRFVAAVLAMFGYAACAQVMMTFLPLYLQNAFGLPAVRAGLGMLPFAIAMVVGPHIGASLSRRIPPMMLLTLGLATIGAGNLLTALFAGMSSYGMIAVGMIVTGLGAGVLNGDTQKAIMACVPPNRTGMASGISTTTRFTAIVTSVGVLGAVLATRTHAALDIHASSLADPQRVLDATFLSRLLAGDLAHAGGSLAGPQGVAIMRIARESFASGFAASLGVAGVCALTIAAAVWLLAGRATVEGGATGSALAE